MRGLVIAYVVIFSAVIVRSAWGQACNADYQFTCSSGKCIRLGYKCDGEKDCEDNSDENDEACPLPVCTESGTFACRGERNCVPNDLKCDDYEDCLDGADEWGC
ncbi:CD320 antigen-like [Amphiura filiformis]|uniref:CD320 antigen-like n=1 Tax=Amphiura filiformis TaxID=82378 RepID=UPI003B20FA9C